LIVFAAVLLALWVTLGQALNNLPIYFSNSWQVMDGYVDGFSKAGPAMQVSLALIVALLLVLVTTRLSWPAAAALGGTAFVTFKHAFVRQDWYHAPGFFAFAALTFASFRVRPWVQKAGLALSFAGLIGYRPDVSTKMFLNHWKDQAAALVRPIQLRKKLDREYVELEGRFAVPRMRETIGAGSVDLSGGDQRRAIFNHLNWRSRPTFEGWPACTPKLLALNAAFLREKTGPDFVIASWNEIDERLPAADDGAALLELFAHYEPVERENYCHLFRRVERPHEELPASVKEVRIGVTIELDSFQTATFEIKYSLLGKLRRFFYKPAPAFIRLTLASGDTKRYRLAPSIVASEFLLNPLLQNLDDIVALYSGPAGQTVQRFEIEADKLWFDQKIKMIFREFLLPQKPPDPASARIKSPPRTGS
jgi:hypothetical protein